MSADNLMSDAVTVPRSEMKFAIAQAIWEIDRNESAAARTLMVAAQNLLTAASTPVGGWEDISTHDGSRGSVLVWCAERRNTYTAIWRDDWDTYGEAGWFHFAGLADRIREVPTHWMPLPHPPSVSIDNGSRPQEAVPTEQADGAVVDLREALSGLLAFTGMFTPEQFATAMWGVHGDELVGVSEVANKFDKAQADAWTALSATPQPADGCSSNEGAGQ